MHSTLNKKREAANEQGRKRVDDPGLQTLALAASLVLPLGRGLPLFPGKPFGPTPTQPSDTGLNALKGIVLALLHRQWLGYTFGLDLFGLERERKKCQ